MSPTDRPPPAHAFEVRHDIGRLVEIAILPHITVEDARLLDKEVRAIYALSPRNLVSVVDFSRSTTVPPEVTDTFVELMKSDNAKLDRGAFYLSTNAATVGLQIERMLRDARNPNRKAFRVLAELHAWLDPVLDATERARIRDFLKPRALSLRPPR